MKGWIRIHLVVVLVLAFFLSACGGGYASQFRLVLLAAPPLVESLNLAPALKNGLIQDFTDIANDTLDFSDCLKGASGNPAKLVCVQTLDIQAESVVSRGHFADANNAKLQRVLGLIRGIIASAKIYYGGGSNAPAGMSRGIARPVTEDSIKKQIADLKAEMQP